MERRKSPLAHPVDDPPSLLACLAYSALAAFAVMFLLPFVLMLPQLAWLGEHVGTPLELMLNVLLCCLVVLLGWRTWRYGFHVKVPARPPVVRAETARKPVPRSPWLRFNLLHALLIAVDAVALWIVVPALLSWRYGNSYGLGPWAHLVYAPAVLSVPFGMVLSSEFQKQAEQREWPAAADTILTAFCTLVFTPLYCWSLLWVVTVLYWGLPVVAMVTLLFWFVWLLACAIWGDENMVLRRFLQRHRHAAADAGRSHVARKTLFRFNLAHLLMVVVASGLVGSVLSQGAYVSALHKLTPRPLSVYAFDTGWRASEGYFDAHPLGLMVLVMLFALLGIILSAEVARAGEKRSWPASTVNAIVALLAFVALPMLLLAGLAFLENIVVGISALFFTGTACCVAWAVAAWLLGGERKETAIRRGRARKHLRPRLGKGKKHTPRYEPKYAHVPSTSDYIKRII